MPRRVQSDLEYFSVKHILDSRWPSMAKVGVPGEDTKNHKPGNLPRNFRKAEGFQSASRCNKHFEIRFSYD